jgi:hypothetical protein
VAVLVGSPDGCIIVDPIILGTLSFKYGIIDLCLYDFAIKKINVCGNVVIKENLLLVIAKCEVTALDLR